jgi:predicted ATPase
MRRLQINNLGALKAIDILFSQVNVIIGPQSLGKSTILKVASYCTWVEKRIELTQNYAQFAQGDSFIKELVEFHKLNGYVHPNTYIEYETDFMKFSYNHEKSLFHFIWKNQRWEYKRTKVSYIPSERNLVAAIPNWYEVSMGRNNIRSFMTDWETARQVAVDNVDILDLDVTYHYESDGKKDKVESHHSNSLDFTNTSSGLQSLIPLFVHLNYLYSIQYQVEKDKKIKGDWENDNLLNVIYSELFQSKGRTKAKLKYIDDGHGGKVKVPVYIRSVIGNMPLRFSEKEDADECKAIYERYLMTDHSEVFLEEPENNLFPPTQDSLVKWLLDKTLDEHPNTLYIATHSPYVLSSILEEDSIPLSLFFVYEKDGESIVKTATREDMRGIYDYGIDAFFNLDNLVSE